MKLVSKYTYENLYGNPRHTYSVIGGKGAVHFHVTEIRRSDDECVSAGLEFHHREPPEYMKDDAPHEKCWLIGGACWHDGTSLYAQDKIVPVWQDERHDTEAFLKTIEYEYKKHFHGGD